MKWQQYACRFASTLVKEVLLDRVLFHPHGAGDKKTKMVKNMKNEKTNENRDNVAAIGIGAMIVFIALILVAAVAAAVIIQTAEKLQQNAQSTGEETTDLMASKISVLSVVISTTTQVTVTFELAPGSDGIAAADVDFNLQCPGTTPVVLSGTFGGGGAGGTAAAVFGTAGVSPMSPGATYSVAIATGTAECQPSPNDEDTLLIQAGSGGWTYEVLQYSGSAAVGEVVA